MDEGTLSPRSWWVRAGPAAAWAAHFLQEALTSFGEAAFILLRGRKRNVRKRKVPGPWKQEAPRSNSLK